jgi:hypothetical protein
MSTFQWRNNPVPKLTGADGRALTLADFRIWTNEVHRSMRAVGASYIIELLKLITYVGGKFPRLCDATADDEWTSGEFKARVVQLADQNGKIFPEPNPAAAPAVKKNYQAILDDVQSFGAQISRACPEDHRSCFNQPELQAFPLFPLIEWHMLGDSFDPNRDSDSTEYWQALSNALSEPINLSNAGMQAWISRISNARNDLIKIEPPDAVDSAIIGPTINKFLNLDDEKGGVKWQIKAAAWHEVYINSKKDMSWLRLKQSILQTLTSSNKHKPDYITDDHTTTNPKRPKLNPTLPAQT